MTQCRTQASVEAAARARAADAVRVLKDAAIRAPFAGLIAERFVNVGDYVQPSSKVVTLLVDNPLRLRLNVPEAVIPFTSEGTVVKFKVLTMPDREFSATIKYVGREVRASSRDLITEAVVDNREQLLLPGLFVTVSVPTGTSNQAIVPKSALVSTESEPTVFAIVDDRLEQRAVRVGASLAQGVAVAEGLKRGDRVVLNPAADLKDGSPVQVR
jgi:membrane fusion protein, multidrug efflux system